MNNRCNKLLDLGFKIFLTCYENSNECVQRAYKQGFNEVVTVKVRTDTPGIKMYAVLVK